MPVLVWMLIIFTASTDLMSAEHSSRFIEPFLRWLPPEISAGTIRAVQYCVRKMAHLTEYAILGALVLRALRTFATPANRVRPVAAFLVAAIFAASDEFHQSFVASRTASPSDVLIDACGAAIGLIAYWFLAQRSRQGIAQVRAQGTIEN